MANKLDGALQTAISTVPECVAAGYVDLSTGMLLGIKTVDSHPQEVLELLAAATSDMFQGSNVTTIEKMFKKTRGLKDDGHHYFNEMVVNSDNLIHVFLRGQKNEEHVLGLVCRKSANLGMVLTKARAMVGPVEAAV
jgi:hypothetical protein